MERLRDGITPGEWGASLSGPPIISSDPRLLRGGLLRRWSKTAGGMRQPALDHHYIVLHLGGPKTVRRSGAGRTLETQVTPGQMTVVPAGSAYDWVTDGPIDFAHLYISPKRLDRTINEAFDREPRSVSLQDRVGFNDALLERLTLTMLDDLAAAAPPSRLYFEGLFDAAVLRVIRQATNASEVLTGGRQALAPAKLRRVQAFIEDHLGEDLDLQALADVAGLSRFHFSRAFQQTTSFSPYLFVTRQRIARAKTALSETDAPISVVARQNGFNSPAQFSSTFKKVVGVSPRAWRSHL